MHLRQALQAAGLFSLMQSSPVLVGVENCHEGFVDPVGLRECPCHPCHAEPRRSVHETDHGLVQALSVPASNLDAGYSIQHELAWSADVRNDHRKAGSLSFKWGIAPGICCAGEKFDVGGS